MKFTSLAAAAATAGLVAGAPRVVTVRPEDLRVSTLGGSTFRVKQVHNQRFNLLGKGPRARAKAYQKYGMDIPAELLAVLDDIAAKLGVTPKVLSLAANGTAGANGTASPGQGTCVFLADIERRFH